MKKLIEKIKKFFSDEVKDEKGIPAKHYKTCTA